MTYFYPSDGLNIKVVSEPVDVANDAVALVGDPVHPVHPSHVFVGNFFTVHARGGHIVINVVLLENNGFRLAITFFHFFPFPLLQKAIWNLANEIFTC